MNTLLFILRSDLGVFKNNVYALSSRPTLRDSQC